RPLCGAQKAPSLVGVPNRDFTHIAWRVAIAHVEVRGWVHRDQLIFDDRVLQRAAEDGPNLLLARIPEGEAAEKATQMMAVEINEARSAKLRDKILINRPAIARDRGV